MKQDVANISIQLTSGTDDSKVRTEPEQYEQTMYQPHPFILSIAVLNGD